MKYEESGKFKDISDFCFEYFDAGNIECLEEQLGYYCDLGIDPDSLEFDEEYYDLYIDRHYPGFKELLELVSLLNDKIKKEEPTFNLIFDSNSESDSESESESDSDSDYL